MFVSGVYRTNSCRRHLKLTTKRFLFNQRTRRQWVISSYNSPNNDLSAIPSFRLDLHRLAHLRNSCILVLYTTKPNIHILMSKPKLLSYNSSSSFSFLFCTHCLIDCFLRTLMMILLIFFVLLLSIAVL